MGTIGLRYRFDPVAGVVHTGARHPERYSMRLSSTDREKLARGWRHWQGALPILVFLLSAAPDWAQAPDASMGGSVRSRNGDPIASAEVIAKHLATGQSRTVYSDDAGNYHLPSLPPGTY